MLTVKSTKKHSGKTKKDHSIHTTDVTGKTWNITNNSGIDIVVINAFTENDDNTTELYQQSLQTLATNDGKKLITAGDTGTVSISGDQIINNLIIAKAVNLAPLKVMDAPASGQTEISVTITTGDVSNAVKAETFEQSIVAFPTSGLAKGYVDALSSDDPATINSYIQSQDGYANVTANLVLAYQTYYSRFPFAYAAYKADQSYYCYASDGDDITFEGSFEIFNDNPASPDTDTALSKFTTIFSDKTESTEINLYYADGQLSDDSNAATPAICLTGMFIQRSQLTKVDADKGLMPTFCGTVNGKSVLVYDQHYTKNKDGAYEGFDALLHPETVGDWISLSMLIVAALGGIVLLALVAKTVADSIRKNNLTPEEIAAEKARVTEAYRNRIQETLTKIDKKLKIPAEEKVSLDEIKKIGNDTLLADNQRKILDTVTQQQSYYEKMLEFTDSDKMDQAYDNMSYVYETVRGAQPADLADQMPDLLARVKSTTGMLNDVYKGIKDKSFDQYKAAVSEAQKLIDKSTTALDKNEDLREDLKNDEIPEIDIVE